MSEIKFDLGRLTGEYLEDYLLLGMKETTHQERARILAKLLTVAVGEETMKQTPLLTQQGRDLMQRFSAALAALNDPNS